MKLKKLLAGALAAVVAVGSLSVVSFADPGDTGTYGDFEYTELSNGNVSITGYIGDGGDIVVPSDINGKTVTQIGSKAFEGCETITSVEIPSTVISINNDAFYKCLSLTAIDVNAQNSYYKSVDGVLFRTNSTSVYLFCYPAGKKDKTYSIPDDTDYIQYNAFYYNPHITAVVLPDKLNDVSGGLAMTFNTTDRQFEGCFSLEAINVSENNPYYTSVDGVLFNKDKTTIVSYPKGKKGDYTIPDSVTVIGGSSFCDSIYLTDVAIPNSVTYIGFYAFQNCDSLTTVTIPNSVEIIDDAFSFCDSLTTIEIPDSVILMESVIDGCVGFFGCPSLTDINVSDGNQRFYSINGVLYRKETEYSTNALLSYPSGKKETTYTVPNDVSYILVAFSECPYLTSIVIPDSVTLIVGFYGSETFAFNDNLTTIYGYTGSYAETYASDHDITFVPLQEETLTDSDTGIIFEGTAAPDNYQLVAEITDTSEDNDSITYDITLVDADGTTVQPYEAVTIKIPVPEDWETDNLKVYRTEADNTYTDMKAEYSDGYMVFTTDHFSTYILSTVALTEEEEENNGGSNTGSGNTNTGSGSTNTGTSSTTTEATTTEPEAKPDTTTQPDTTPDNGKGEDNGAGNNGGAAGDNPHTGVTLLLIPAITAAAGVILSKKIK